MRRALYIRCCPALWSCNRAGVTGKKMVFLRLTRNSGICSNSVSLAWAGSYRNIQTALTTCPETQWQRGNGCYRAYVLRGGNTPLPPPPDQSSSGEISAVGCLPRLRKTTGLLMLYLGVVSALLQVEGDLPVFIFSPIKGRASLWPCGRPLGALVSMRVTVGVQVLQFKLSLPRSPPLPPLLELGVWRVRAGEMP